MANGVPLKILPPRESVHDWAVGRDYVSCVKHPRVFLLRTGATARRNILLDSEFRERIVRFSKRQK